jgi:mevalonate kinase
MAELTEQERIMWSRVLNNPVETLTQDELKKRISVKLSIITKSFDEQTSKNPRLKGNPDYISKFIGAVDDVLADFEHLTDNNHKENISKVMTGISRLRDEMKLLYN